MSKEKTKTIVIIILAILVVIGAIFIISGSRDKSDIDVSTNNGENIDVNNDNDDVINTTEDNIEHEENDVDSDLNEESVIGAKKITPVTEVPDGYVGIYTVSDLLSIDSNKEMNYILMSDLDLSSYSDWSGLTNNAFFNGNGHTISNLTSSKSGLFKECNKVSGINLENVLICLNDVYGRHDTFRIGSIANTVTKSINNCSVSGAIYIQELDYGSDVIAGGIVGFAENATIEACTNKVFIAYDSRGWGNNYVHVTCSGIVGEIENPDESGWVRNCINYADIYVYGTSFNYNDFSGELILDEVSSYEGVAGGIVGECSPNIYIDSCINLGYIASSEVASGIVAVVNTHFTNETFSVSGCKNFGKIFIDAPMDNEVSHWYSKRQRASGIIGELEHNNANIDSCYSLGEIGGDYIKAGSLIAYSSTDGLTIRNCVYVNNSDFDGKNISLDGKGGMYPESYKNEQISLAEAKKLFPQYFESSDRVEILF